MSGSEIGRNFKVVFVGNSGVGKTSMVQKFCMNQYPETHIKTLTSQFYEKQVDVSDSNEPMDLMIWDTPGRENLHLLAEDSFENTSICVVVYAINDRQSFETVPQWVERVKAVSVNSQVVLVENKVDCLDQTRVQKEEGQRMANQLDAPLFRVSVKEGMNLRNLFAYLALTLRSKFLSSLNSLPAGSEAFFANTIDDNGSTEYSENEAEPDGAVCNVA